MSITKKIQDAWKKIGEQYPEGIPDSHKEDAALRMHKLVYSWGERHWLMNFAHNQELAEKVCGDPERIRRAQEWQKTEGPKGW